MAEPRIKTTIEFDPSDYERLRAYADQQDVGLATAIIGLLDGKRPRIAFQPPSVTDVTEYCVTNRYTFDPEAFVAFYASKGWKVGHDPMKNWKAACVTWQKRELEKNGQNGNVTKRPDTSDSEKRAAEQREAAKEIAEIERLRKERGL